MAKDFLTSIDMNKNEILNHVLQNLGTPPAGPLAGQIYHDTTDNVSYIYDGTTWNQIENADAFSAFTDGTNTATPLDGEINPGEFKFVSSNSIVTVTVGNNDGTHGDHLDVGINTTAFDTQVQTSRLDQMAAPTASVDFNSQLLTNVATPVAGTDGANKAYVDAFVQGADWKESVRVATTAAGTLASSFENGDTIDGVVLSTGDRILIKDQADPIENGIYVVEASGAPTRADDADATGEMSGGTAVFVEEGTVNADTGWVITSDGDINPGVDANAWTQFAGVGSVIDGDGLGKSGNTFFVNTGDGIEIVSDNVSVNVDAAGALVFNTGELAVNVDTTSIVINGSNQLEIGSVPAAAIDVSALAGLGLVVNGTALDVNVGNGIEINTDTVEAAIDTTKGLEFDTGNIAVKVEADGAIVFDGTNGGLEVQVDASSIVINGSNQLEIGSVPAAAIDVATLAGLGLSANGNALDVNVGNGLEINVDTIEVALATASALSFDSTGDLLVNTDGTSIVINGSNELEIGSVPAAAIDVAALAGAGLVVNGNALDVNVGNGIEINTDTVEVALAPFPGLTFDSNGDLLALVDNSTIQINPSGELEVIGSGGAGTESTTITWLSGSGAGQSFAFNHGLGTRDVIVQTRRNASPYDYVETEVEATDINNVTIRFGRAPGSDTDIRIIVTG